MTSFGEELKRERELRDISLKEISEATKISIRFLEALEQNNFDILPGGIFNRGFIRSYARFIGVDGEEMVNAYLHEISLKESGKGQGALAGIAAGSETGAVFRPEKTRRGPGAEPRVERRVEPRQTPHVVITPESRFTISASSEDSGGRASMAIWILVVLAVFVGGAGLLTMRMSGSRPTESSTGSHVQAVKARLNKIPPATAAVSSPAAPASEPISGEPISTERVAVPADPQADPGGQPDNPDSPAEVPPAETATPPAVEHMVMLRISETTVVTLECAGQVSLSQELWAGGSKRLTCAEPVVLSADNGGAVEFSLDGGPTGFLGAMGERVEARVVAPVPEPAQPDRKSADVAGETHAGN